MAGSKRAKLKKVFSPTPTPPPVVNADDRELMDDLMAQLDSRNEEVQAQSTAVLTGMQINQQADLQRHVEKQDANFAKSRFRARQVSQVKYN